jgi:hypothetical protein
MIEETFDIIWYQAFHGMQQALAVIGRCPGLLMISHFTKLSKVRVRGLSAVSHDREDAMYAHLPRCQQW